MDTTKTWRARWIQDADFGGFAPLHLLHKELEPFDLPEHPVELLNRHMLVRRVFTLGADECAGKRMWLDISADDYFKLYLNGAFVAQGPAQGYAFHYPYMRLDVTQWLRPGDNVIAVHVYYQGLINRAYNSGDLRQGMIAELFADDRLLLASDDTWKYAVARQYGDGTAETVGYRTQFLEHIDSRLEERGWREKAYDDNAWKACHAAEDDDHLLALQSTPPLAVYWRPPASVANPEPGRYVIDFGTELTGQFTMEARGAPGERLEIRCGEELDDTGEHVRYDMRCNCKYSEWWTLSGGLDVLEPFEYKAFRYVEVIGSPTAIRPASFAAIVRHYPFDGDACRFDASDAMLRQVWTICRSGLQYGTQEQFVDCPSREKGQYLGDNTVIMHAHLYATGDLRMVKKALADFALAARHICPGGMAVAPGSFMQEIADFSFQWPMQLLEYYRHSGDLDFLREMEPIAGAMIRHFDRYRSASGLLEHVSDKWNLVDWPDGLRDGYDFPLTRPVGPGCHNVVNAFYYGARKALADIRATLGTDPDSEESTAGLERFRDEFVRAFYDAENRRFVDAIGSKHASLHANALPLLFGLVPDDAVASVVSWLKGRNMNCGVYFAYFLLKALAAAGDTAYVYARLTAEDAHSWGNMVKEGATTCFEAWGKEQKWNTSLCHPWASAPIPLFIEEIMGLKPAAPGWEAIRLAPRIPDALERFDFACRVRTGTIRIAYAHGELAIEAPEGVPIIRE
ncbi:Alpha-L-rhamnosidase N-terminal domain-containing protein [Cohnella sp. OV330]|uniref:family 78 glycoside hydrolase catalytic domain n=1 Tax=Cohnella sp. OV330 TaxID=1855288 RepID=UPI0008E957A3|nr:family 78 glycoside hydrolase catalytic domain [Cohnella sp. OV330]SFA79550.1 Alpha-L-rhamnosidase N-terminal domain-containing protein [Cohnella sp. OV330]